MTTSYTTEYPNAELASDVVGFTSNPAGRRQPVRARRVWRTSTTPCWPGGAGSEEVEVGTDSEPIPLTEVKLTPAVPARSLRLTIQADIQYEADQVCKQRVAQTHARNCSIIVMDPKTGAILAMAQWPTYNPDDPVPYASTTNIGTANVFAPGSTLKPVTVAAALEQGGQTPMSAYTIPYQITMDGLLHLPRRRTAPDGAVHHRRDPRALQQRRHGPGRPAHHAAAAVRLPAGVRPRLGQRPRHDRGERRAAADARDRPGTGRTTGTSTPSARESA